MEILQYQFIQNAIISSILAGIGCSLIGVLLISLEIPFLSVTMSHSAFAGAIFGIIIGANPFICSFIFCCLVSLFIGPIADRANFKIEISNSILFSMTLGFAFLFFSYLSGPKTDALFYIWGNILTISKFDVLVIAATTFIVLIFFILFFRQIKAILFNREIAASVGIPERAIYYSIIFLSGAVISANLPTIGGLLIFSLVINPAVSAFQLTYNFKRLCILAVIFGIISCILGLYFSYIFNLPTGAVIVIFSNIIFLLCFLFSPKRRVRHFYYR